MPSKNSISPFGVLISAFAMLSLASCSGFPEATPAEDTVDRNFGTGSLITGNSDERGVNLTKLLNPEDTGQGGGLQVNALLWRASLDTVSVLPLASVDTFGGTIITDWYAHPEEDTKRIKLAIFVIDQELRADSIKVQVYLQERPEGMFDWSDLGRDDSFATRIEDLILTRAREIRALSITESN